jgi:acyl-CoA reductase-like NAD-dependent aldehyde dehydrogenase
MMSELRTDFLQLVDGAMQSSDELVSVINPATGQVFAHCPSASRTQLDAAVAGAQRAFDGWRRRSFEDRRQFIGRMAEVLRTHQGQLAELLTREQGKPLSQARDEIARAASQSEGMAAIAIESELITDNAERRIELQYQPLGVVGIIVPWNAPVNLAAGPLTAALYTGNTVVLKPSPFAPLTVLKMAELLRDVFPPGVINVLAGGDALGQWMSEHPGIAKISFTGSVATGKKVMAAAAGTLKRITLELGGNDAAIVLDDADVGSIAPKLFFAATVNSGQVCMAIKRIYAHDSLYDPLCAALADQARKAVVGDGRAAGTEIGPIQNERQFRRVQELLADTRARGATLQAGAALPAGDGYFVAPTIVSEVPDDARIVQEEQFGPIVPVLRYHDVDDALRRANATRFGLAGSVWSSNATRAAEVANRLEVGTAWINQHRATAANVPFGGAKESGIGRHYSILGLKSNMEPRVVSLLK